MMVPTGRGRVKVRVCFPKQYKIQRRIFVVLASVLFLLCSYQTQHAYGQAPSLGGGGLAASGGETADRLKAEMAGKNKYRVDKDGGSGGVSDQGQVLKEMQNLLNKIMIDPNIAKNPLGAIQPREDLDEWFNPHSRDASIDPGLASLEATAPWSGRMWAGTYDWGLFGCDGACPGCRWHNPFHWTGKCCGVNTQAYADKVTPTNFKACCVPEQFRCATMEEIACSFPAGNGWAGLFEYYFPVNIIGWESQRATTMIASRGDVQKCLDDSNSAMENSKWVTDAIQKMEPSAGDVQKKVQDSVSAVRPKDESLRFSDTLQGGGLTMRVNFAHMDPVQRMALAVQFCMHPLQFMKLMDPQWDKLQMPGTGGPSLGALQNTQTIPIWANYCPSAVKLMTDPKETFKILNVDFTPTDFIKGMMTYLRDPLYCQKMNATANPQGAEFLADGVLKAASNGGGGGSQFLTQEAVGYTCRTGDFKKGGFSTRMVPVELHSTASVDQRTLDHAIPFMIAAGYYPGTLFNGVQSVYKRFEPRPYSQKLDLFTGARWEGVGPNELGQLCRSYKGKDLKGKNVSDQLYLSDIYHQPFTQEKIMDSGSCPSGNCPGAEPIFNRYDREWADKQPENFHNRNVDQSVLNYGAAFRIFATCPAGYVRWKGPHSEKFDEACGEENFGGRLPPSPPCPGTF